MGAAPKPLPADEKAAKPEPGEPPPAPPPNAGGGLDPPSGLPPRPELAAPKAGAPVILAAPVAAAPPKAAAAAGAACPTGDAVVSITAAVPAPLYFSLLMPSGQAMPGGRQLLVSTAIFRSEPYPAGNC